MKVISQCKQIKMLLLLLILLACDRRTSLIDNSWILVAGTMDGKPIAFESTERLFLINQNGEIIRQLDFYEDQTISLPGIHSNNISAIWTLEEEKIRFSIDSSSYLMFAPSSIKSGDSSASSYLRNRLLELEKPMQIYGQDFEFRISHDTLQLFSSTVKLWAVKDRTIEKMMKVIKP
jgi:hypothetical protein